jgi:hypothetical protein
MSTILQGRAILIVEDEPLIAMEIVRAFESAGVRVLKTGTLHHALVLLEDANAGLSAAVLDHGLRMVTAPNCASGSKISTSRSCCTAGIALLKAPAGTQCSWPSQSILRCSSPPLKICCETTPCHTEAEPRPVLSTAAIGEPGNPIRAALVAY